jgi:hypothetical protein
MWYWSFINVDINWRSCGWHSKIFLCEYACWYVLSNEVACRVYLFVKEKLFLYWICQTFRPRYVLRYFAAGSNTVYGLYPVIKSEFHYCEQEQRHPVVCKSSLNVGCITRHPRNFGCVTLPYIELITWISLTLQICWVWNAVHITGIAYLSFRADLCVMIQLVNHKNRHKHF